MICNLSNGLIKISANTVTCASQSSSSIQELTVTGGDQIYGINVTNSKITIHLSSQSSVTVILSGENTVRSNSSSKAAVDCGQWSNVTFLGMDDSSLSATGGRLSSGIGTTYPQNCGLLHIVNGTYDISGATGLGVGYIAIGTCGVDLIQIDNGMIAVHGSNGAGIGSGSAWSYAINSQVNSIIICNGTINATSILGAGIGSGWATKGSAISLKVLELELE